MNSMTSDQEAVCACVGHAHDRYHPGTCACCDFILAPVVPSDDALCDECGHVLTWGCHGPAQDRLISILGGELEFPHPFHAPGTGGMYADKRKASAPPTPSQDAEGEGLALAWGTFMHEFTKWLRDGSGNPDAAMAGVESSIRADYEELVKAEIARKAAERAMDTAPGMEQIVARRALVDAEDRIDAALTRIEESL